MLLSACDLLGPSAPDPSLDSLAGIRVARFHAAEGELLAAATVWYLGLCNGGLMWLTIEDQGDGAHPFGSVAEATGSADHYVGCSSYPLNGAD
jgi:hypothetical protein